MAKGQAKCNKETKTPKAVKNQPKTGGSAYKLALSSGGQSALIAPKKS